MRKWFDRHRVVSALIATTLALAATEGIVVLYYLDSWLTLPL